MNSILDPGSRLPLWQVSVAIAVAILTAFGREACGAAMNPTAAVPSA